MGSDGNEMADQLARQGFSPLTGPEPPALGISAKVAREVIRGWMSKKHEEYWQSMDKSKLRASIRDPPLKELENYST
jgi:hypothetical protein